MAKQTIKVKLNDEHRQQIKDRLIKSIEPVIDAWIDEQEFEISITDKRGE